LLLLVAPDAGTDLPFAAAVAWRSVRGQLDPGNGADVVVARVRAGGVPVEVA
jgi:hypothetical protein